MIGGHNPDAGRFFSGASSDDDQCWDAVARGTESRRFGVRLGHVCVTLALLTSCGAPAKESVEGQRVGVAAGWSDLPETSLTRFAYGDLSVLVETVVGDGGSLTFPEPWGHHRIEFKLKGEAVGVQTSDLGGDFLKPSVVFSPGEKAAYVLMHDWGPEPAADVDDAKPSLWTEPIEATLTRFDASGPRTVDLPPAPPPKAGNATFYKLAASSSRGVYVHRVVQDSVAWTAEPFHQRNELLQFFQEEDFQPRPVGPLIQTREQDQGGPQRSRPR